MTCDFYTFMQGEYVNNFDDWTEEIMSSKYNKMSGFIFSMPVV